MQIIVANILELLEINFIRYIKTTRERERLHRQKVKIIFQGLTKKIVL